MKTHNFLKSKKETSLLAHLFTHNRFSDCESSYAFSIGYPNNFSLYLNLIDWTKCNGIYLTDR